MQEYYGETLSNLDLSHVLWSERLYEDCLFQNCRFDHTVLENLVLRDCRFVHCEWNNVSPKGVKIQHLQFETCRWVGIRLDMDIPLPVQLSFRDSRLHLCSFEEIKISPLRLENCQVWECNFMASILREAVFCGSDFTGSVWEDNDLSDSDFRQAQAYDFDPRQNRVRGGRFSLPEVLSFLKPYEIKIE